MDSLGGKQRNLKNFSLNILLLVLWFGTLWGAVEALVGGLLHYFLPPTVPGKIMIVIATGLMAWSLRKTGKVWMPLAISLIAAPLKLFSGVVFSLPLNAPAILNPVFGILSQGLGFTLVTLAIYKLPIRKSMKYLAIGAGAGAIYSFVFIGLVAGPGMALYLPMEAIQELGTKFPYWARSVSGLMGFASSSLPYSAIVAGLGGLLAGVLPFNVHPRLNPRLLLSGSVLWLTIFFVSSLTI
ncbi:MAG: hypothetical protein V5A87_05825 [Candidatus Bipolaricaulota bacterium]|nr:hypothetical protein [Candidatus Bipolaricaulota bacterium]